MYKEKEMTKKEYLDSIKNIDNQVTTLFKLVEKDEEKLTLYSSSACLGVTEDGKKEPVFVRILASKEAKEAKLEQLDEMERDFEKRVYELKDSREQIVFIRFYLCDERLDDIASAMDISAKTVSRLLHKGFNDFHYPEYVVD